MAVHQRLLNRMEPVTAGQIFQGNQLFTVQASDQSHTGIDRLVMKTIAFSPADNYRTGPAVPGSTTLLRTATMQVIAQVFKQSGIGIEIDDFRFNLID